MLSYSGKPCQVMIAYLQGLCYRCNMLKAKAQEAAGGAWVFRNVPRDVMRHAKIVAAVESTSVKQLLIRLLRSYVQELERKGILPKGKG